MSTVAPGESAPKITIQVCEELQALARSAAEHVFATANEALTHRSVFNIALSGGKTPRSLYELIAAEAVARDLELEHWQVWFGDERCVLSDHPDSNYRMAHEAWLARAGLAPANIHRIRTELGGPDVVAEAYEKELATVFGLASGARPVFDLVLLGLGPDGHTASLFPGTRALQETVRNVVANRVEQLATDRITLTYPALDAARAVQFMVAGSDKADAVAAVLAEAPFPHFPPAKRVRPRQGSVTWLLDRPAASKLPR